MKKFFSLHSIPFHSIPFHSIPFHSIPFHSIPFHSQHFTAVVVAFLLGFLVVFQGYAQSSDPCAGCDGRTEVKSMIVYPACCPGCPVTVSYLITYCDDKNFQIWIMGFTYDYLNDPDCQQFWAWLNATSDATNWSVFMRQAFRDISVHNADSIAQANNYDCQDENDQGIITSRIYWKPCVDFSSIEIPNQPIVWCKFGNCCVEWYRMCRDTETGQVFVLEHGEDRLTTDRCQEEPGRFCVPAFCGSRGRGPYEPYE